MRSRRCGKMVETVDKAQQQDATGDICLLGLDVIEPDGLGEIVRRVEDAKGGEAELNASVAKEIFINTGVPQGYLFSGECALATRDLDRIIAGHREGSRQFIGGIDGIILYPCSCILAGIDGIEVACIVDAADAFDE